MQRTNLPALLDENLRKNQTLIELILPTLSDEAIKNAFDKAIPIESKQQIESEIKVEPESKLEPYISVESKEALIIEEKYPEKTIPQKKTAKSHDEIMAIMNQKNKSNTESIPDTINPQQQLLDTVVPEPPNKNLHTLLTGDLIKLCSIIEIRLEWYSDIELMKPQGINERKELRETVFKFETQTISSLAKQLFQKLKLLEFQKYDVKETLSSAEGRSYTTVYTEFEHATKLEDKISLLHELKMIPSAWLPTQAVYNRRKNVSPVISGKIASSNEKGE